MKKLFLAMGLITAIIVVTYVHSSAEVACISKNHIRLVPGCGECRGSEYCGAIVTAPQDCPTGHFVTALNDSGDLVCTALTTLLDGDGDGQISAAFGGPDCDDSDPDIYFGAEEICDSLDNDCNGVVDDRDIDDDGYIDDDPVCGGNDCDDLNNSVNPGAQEICEDGLDNNCDGTLDEGCGSESNLVINEIDYDQVSTDTMEFVEIKNPTDMMANLAGISVKFVNGSTGLVYLTINLQSLGQLEPLSYLVIGAPDLLVAPGALKIDFAQESNNIQNGPNDCIKIIGPQGTIDRVSYEGSLGSCIESDPTTAEDLGPGSIGRVPDGADTDNNNQDFSFLATPSPGSPNSL